MDLAKQYDDFAADFSDSHNSDAESRYNREQFYKHIDFIKEGMKLLDIGCGDGLDLSHYKQLGSEVFGIDASEELAAIAKKRLPDTDIQIGTFETLPFEDNYFDIVLSKYAIMTSPDMQPVLREMHRVLVPGGMMMYLVTHPFRQYFERKNKEADYFKQTIVDSKFFHNTITAKEPTHTMGEYLNEFLFKNFEVQMYDEEWDPAAEQIESKKYPGFLILKAKKRG